MSTVLLYYPKQRRLAATLAALVYLKEGHTLYYNTNYYFGAPGKTIFKS